MTDELSEYLLSLEQNDRYRVIDVLKTSPTETTERVRFTPSIANSSGIEQDSPSFIRKRISLSTGLGTAYEQLYQHQRDHGALPSIPYIVECFTTESELVVVMEDVGGETLVDVLERIGPSYALADNIFVKTCEAVMDLHERFSPPIIHRDLKPSNVVIAGSRLAIVDFGIARNFDESNDRDTQCFGTKGFAPPEQFGFGQTSTRSDCYALGMMLYCCLTGKEPAPGLYGDAFFQESLPDRYQRVLARATAFDPEKRYRSVREMRDDFIALHDSALPEPQGQPVLAAPRTIGPYIRFGWNVFLTVLWVFFIVCGIWLIVNPNEQSAQYALPARIILYPAVVIGLFGPLYYLLLDKSRLRKRVPFMRSISRRAEFIACVIVALVSFFLIGIVGNL